MNCQLKNLVQTELVHIQQCTCGLVHLHIGALTLRFPQNDLGNLSQALMQAEARMTKAMPEEVQPKRFHQKVSFRLE